MEAAALTVLSFSNPVGLFIIISPDEKTSNSLYTESHGICPDSSYLFPDLEPENDRVPGFVSEGQRYAEEALSVLFSKNGGGRIFTTNSALRSARAPRLGVENKEIVVRHKQKLKMTNVVQFLDRWGYQKTDRVESPLDYTIRGGILDVYLVHSRNPIRIEFFGDKIESIRLFNPRSQ